MEENKYLQVRKEGIFSKVVRFFKQLFKTREDIKQEENKNNSVSNVMNTDENVMKMNNNSNIENKTQFKDNIKLGRREEKSSILDLQKKFENNEIKLSDMTDEEVHNLNLLYKKQVAILKKKIENRKTDLIIMKHKIKGYLKNA